MYYVKQSYLSWRYLLMQTSRQKNIIGETVQIFRTVGVVFVQINALI